MPTFQYSGYTPDGSRDSGTLEADSVNDCIRILKLKKIYPKEVRREGEASDDPMSTGIGAATRNGADTATRKGNGASLRRGFSNSGQQGVSVMTRQLSILMSAGVPLVDAVKTLTSQQKGRLRGVLVRLRERLAAGASLSRAMEDFPDIFPEFYVNMVGAGEAGGSLDVVLENLADFLETQEELKSSVRAATVYPAIMLSVAALVLVFVFVFVVPKITRIFEESSRALPFVTVVLIWISKLFQHYWWALGIAAIAAYSLLKNLIMRHPVYVGLLLNRVPLLNALYLSRFLRMAGFLLSSGVPVLKTMRLASKTIGNRYLEEHIVAAEANVAEGMPLSTALSVLPPVVMQIVATGEKTGTLPKMLLKAATAFENDFQRGVKKGLTMLEPMMVLIMGLIVGFIVFSVLLPIFELNQIIK
ncbi:MAG: type II secretion system F family protein [Nitrospirae bacterium]|nr:type II secretion system F family protein [Nitrospirota bacterium]